MKRNRWLAYMFTCALAVGLVAGCGDDDDDDSNPTAPNNTGDLTADDLSEAELQAAVESSPTSMNASAQQTMLMASGMKAQFNGANLQPLSVRDVEGIQPQRSLADAPENWTGPDGDGWYTYDGSEYNYGTLQLRMTPDRWDDSWDGEPLTRLEYMTSYGITQQGTTIDYSSHYWGETNAERTTVDGAMEYDITTTSSAGGVDFSYDYGYDLTYSDVSLESGNYSGTFKSNTDYPVIGATGAEMVRMTTDITLNADGTGSGTGTIAGVEYVRYTFEGVSSGMMNGYYTLRSEDWDVEHDFSWQVVR